MQTATQAFAVDIVYAQTNGALASLWGRPLQLAALPRTDIPNTYAEWQLFVPASLRLSDFGGSMNIANGTTYELLDAWEKFLAFYGQVLHEAGGAILFIGLLAFLVIALVISAVQRGWHGVITLFAVVAMLFVLGAMLLPALSAAKRKAQRINSVNNLKEVGLAVRVFAGDNGDRLPMSFDEMKNELGTDRITYDTETGQRYIYLGGGMSLDSLKPESVLAYSPILNGHCNVLFADGSVAQMSDGKFAELSQRGLVQVATQQEIAMHQQQAAIAGSQLADAPGPVPSGASTVSGTAIEFDGGSGGGVVVVWSGYVLRTSCHTAGAAYRRRHPLPAHRTAADRPAVPVHKSAQCPRRAAFNPRAHRARCTRFKPSRWHGKARRSCSASSYGSGNGGLSR